MRIRSWSVVSSFLLMAAPVSFGQQAGGDVLDKLQLQDRWVDETGDTMTGTLILNPAVDNALDIATGSIYKGGTLFIHNKGGARNTALGLQALANITTGFNNTASGYRALYSNTTGRYNTASGNQALTSNTTGITNTASGYRALYSNTTGLSNTASGVQALYANTTGGFNTASGVRALTSNTTGSNNTASGYRALLFNTTGGGNTASGYRALYSNTTGIRNTASGYRALYYNTTGSLNIAIGNRAGSNLTTGNFNIAIGNSGVAGEAYTIRIGGYQTRTFVAGIHGGNVGATGVSVLINPAGRLGTVSSSRRFKEEIRDMGDTTSRLLGLRPVIFRYKPEVQSGERPIEYGLIAEEVAEVFPELVVYDEEGRPETVKYHLLSSMLLNELKKHVHEEDAEIAENKAEIGELRSKQAAMEMQLAALTLRLDDQAASR